MISTDAMPPTNDDAWLDIVQRSSRPVIIIAGGGDSRLLTSWTMGLDRLIDAYRSVITFIAVDGDDLIGRFRKLGVTILPTIIGYCGGQEYIRIVGDESPTMLKRAIESLLVADAPVERKTHRRRRKRAP